MRCGAAAAQRKLFRPQDASGSSLQFPFPFTGSEKYMPSFPLSCPVNRDYHETVCTTPPRSHPSPVHLASTALSKHLPMVKAIGKDGRTRGLRSAGHVAGTWVQGPTRYPVRSILRNKLAREHFFVIRPLLVLLLVSLQACKAHSAKTIALLFCNRRRLSLCGKCRRSALQSCRLFLRLLCMGSAWFCAGICVSARLYALLFLLLMRGWKLCL
jgi:hypothetical protein